MIAGPAGAAAAVLPDTAVALDWLVHRDRRGPWRGRLATASRVLHSAWTLPLVLAGPVGVAWASHIVLDWLVHPRTALLPPFAVEARSALRWRPRMEERMALWIVLAIAALWRF